jgi:hypothetical protein
MIIEQINVCILNDAWHKVNTMSHLIIIVIYTIYKL